MASKSPKKRAPKAPVNATAAPVNLRSEGQRLLVDVPATHAEVAAKIGATKQAVSYWRRGEKTPGPGARAALRDAYGIDPTTWERTPGGDDAAPAPSRPRAKAASPTARAHAETVSTIEEIEDQLSKLRALQDNRDLLASEQVRLADSMGKLLAIKARLERDRELLEDRIVREHPVWRRIRERLFAALKPYPDAARAVAEALSEGP